MKKYIILLILLFPSYVFAYYDSLDYRCSSSVKTSLKEKANNVVYRISKNIENDAVTYNINFYNIDESLLIKYNNKTITNNITGLKPGETVTIYFYGNDICYDYKVTTKTISIPYYNKYYTRDICAGYEDYYLCQENSHFELNELEFEDKMENYINSLQNSNGDEPDIEEEKLTFWSFVDKYIYIIYALLLLIILSIIFIIIMHKRKKEKTIL